MSTRREQISAKAIELLKANPDGVRYSQLVRMLQKEFPTIPVNTIHGTIWDLDGRLPKEVYKPGRGLFRHTSFRTVQAGEEIVPKIEKFNEEDFYQPFADWLVGELGECTKAIPLGGKKFQDKWGTPDVIGIFKSRESDIIKIPIEIVTAEIKTDASNLITAFGQACSYKLFSNRSYLVIPKQSPEEDLGRLDSLCMIFGLGLILFDNTSPTTPEFEIRVRAAKHEPDVFYANKYLEFVEDKLLG